MPPSSCGPAHSLVGKVSPFMLLCSPGTAFFKNLHQGLLQPHAVGHSSWKCLSLLARSQLKKPFQTFQDWPQLFGSDCWVGSGLRLSWVPTFSIYKAVPAVCFSSVLLLAQVDILSNLFEVRNMTRPLENIQIMCLAGIIEGDFNKTRDLNALLSIQGLSMSCAIRSLNAKLRFIQKELMSTCSGGGRL